MNMPTGFALFAVIGLSACAITSGHSVGPNGRPVHFIDGMSASVSFRKAAELCPHGYDLLGAPRQISLVDYVMTVECRDPGTRQSTAAAPALPAPAQPAAPAAAAPRLGRDAFQAEQLAKAQACNAQPAAALTAQGPGFETYTVSCSTGDVLVIRCEMGSCRSLK